MKLCFSFLILCIVPAFAGAQQIDRSIFNDKMETIRYELNQLTVVDSVFLSDIDSLVLCRTQDDDAGFIHLGFEKIGDTIRMVAQQSGYPIKMKNRIGYFDYDGKTFIVSGFRIDSLFHSGTKKRLFTYKDYIQPSIFMIEDDVPTWILKYDGRLSYDNSGRP